MASSVPNPAAPHSIGSCATDHSSASTSRRVVVRTRRVRAETPSAASENSAKNADCAVPNSCLVMPKSARISGPASPSTALSAKFTSMKASSSHVVRHARLISSSRLRRRQHRR